MLVRSGSQLNVVYRSFATSIEVSEGVTKIDEKAFASCSRLRRVVLPKSLVTISPNAFFDCRQLTEVVMYGNLKTLGAGAFKGCYSLQNITIPASVTSIGDEAFMESGIKTMSVPYQIRFLGKRTFMNCKELQSVELAQGLQKIDDEAFFGCHRLRSITLPQSLTHIGKGAFADNFALTSITIPQKTSVLMEGAFSRCIAMTHAEILSDTTVLANRLFTACENLAEVKLPDTITTLGESVFAGCRKLNFATLPPKLTTISQSAFQACESLTDLDFPDSLTSVGSYAFVGCTSIKTVTLPAHASHTASSFPWGVQIIHKYPMLKISSWQELQKFVPTTIERLSIGGNIKSVHPTISLLNLRELQLEEGCLELKGNSFSNLRKLERVVLPQSLQVVEDRCFTNCENLTEVIISSKTRIVGNAFANCPKVNFLRQNPIMKSHDLRDFANVDKRELTNVEILPPIAVVFDEMFLGCKNLVQVLLPNSLKKIGSKSFADCTQLKTITLPIGLESIAVDAFLGSGLEEIVLSDPKQLSKCIFADNLLGRVKIRFANMDTGCIEENGIIFSADKSELLFCINKQADIVSVPPQVKRIGANAFAGCEKLQAVRFSEGLQSIEESAFQDCKALTSIKIPSSVRVISDYAFFGCSNLSGVRLLPKELQKLGVAAFENCEKLESIKLPCIRVLPAKAFSNCKQMRTMLLGEGSEYIANNAFLGCKKLYSAIIPISVKRVGSYAFGGCENLQKIAPELARLDDQNPQVLVGTIDTCAFAGVNKLQVVEVFSTTVVADGAFEPHVKIIYSNDSPEFRVASEQDIAKLDKNMISNILVDGFDVPVGAFKGFTALTRVRLDNVEKISMAAFEGCTKLKEVELGQSLKHISDRAFFGCEALQIIDLPPTLTDLGENVFEGCTSLTHIQIPEGIISISDRAFYGCEDLQSIDFLGNVQRICWQAFKNCTSLQSINLPHVKHIEDGAFVGCEALKKVLIDKSAQISTTAFDSDSKIAFGKPQAVTKRTYAQTARHALTDDQILQNLQEMELNNIQNWSDTKLKSVLLDAICEERALVNIFAEMPKMLQELHIATTAESKRLIVYNFSQDMQLQYGTKEDMLERACNLALKLLDIEISDKKSQAKQKQEKQKQTEDTQVQAEKQPEKPKILKTVVKKVQEKIESKQDIQEEQDEQEEELLDA